MENKNIKYINRGFNDFKSQLENFSKTYFPNSYSNFTPTSIGTMFMEQSSYVGDVLSFYLDTQVQENFIQYAQQQDNIYNMAYMYGYSPRPTGLATVKVDFFQLVPSKTDTNTGEIIPDYNYTLYIPPNTSLTSNSGIPFITEDPIDFSIDSFLDPTEVTIAEIVSGEPTFFLLKKSKIIKSGEIKSQNFTFGAPEEFPTLEIKGDNIAEIVEIKDSDNNTWYEVDYLGQDLIFNSSISNPNSDNNQVPFLLQGFRTSRRFITRFLDSTTLQIQFGSGDLNKSDESFLPNPNDIAMRGVSQDLQLTTAYSPTNYIFSNAYGTAPTNTTLTIKYLTGGGIESNIPANSLVNIDSTQAEFINGGLDTSLANTVLNTLSVNNPEAAFGGGEGDTLEEIKLNSLSNFSTQLRNVTPNDYLVRALSMPPKYGIISKAYQQKPRIGDKNSVLDLYVLSYNTNKKLIPSSPTLKENLKNYLLEYAILGDNINIKDAFVINIGINFDIITLLNTNSTQVLTLCIEKLKEYFNIDKWQINQPIIIQEIYNILDNVDGVQTVKNVEVFNLKGTNSNYSPYSYDIFGATQNNIIYPSLDPSIFEVKFPNQDIKGSVSNF